jgi:hypothetical protein
MPCRDSGESTGSVWRVGCYIPIGALPDSRKGPEDREGTQWLAEWRTPWYRQGPTASGALWMGPGEMCRISWTGRPPISPQAPMVGPVYRLRHTKAFRR